ncbi:MAG: hypothetical protein BWZ06_01159 [Bacteroidetes bacterium ADurb.BinA261]|nr:MAG: hypothetical protein BWZ06_01159 [Bacteroidetes bacterium ADurb.BinA261]
MLEKPAERGVSGLVDGNRFFFVLSDNFILFLQSADDAVHGIKKIFFLNKLFVSSGSDECCFVAHIGDVGSRKSGSLPSEKLYIDGLVYFDRSQVHFEYFDAIVQVGKFYIDLTIETSGAKKRFV